MARLLCTEHEPNALVIHDDSKPCGYCAEEKVAAKRLEQIDSLEIELSVLRERLTASFQRETELRARLAAVAPPCLEHSLASTER